MQEDMAPGRYGLSVSPFYSYGNPLVRIELVRTSAAGSEVLAKTQHRFLDAAPARAELDLMVGKYVSPGDKLSLRVTAIEAGDPRYWLRLVLNAGNTERASYLSCPLRTSGVATE